MNPRHLLFILFLFSNFNLVFAKEELSDAKFDSLFFNIVNNSLHNDSELAINLTESLINASTKPNHKIRSTLLLALVYENKGEIDNAIYWATQSEELALSSADNEFRIRAAGYLAVLYRRVNLFSESRRYVEIADKSNAKRKDKKGYNNIQGIIHSDKAYLEIEKGNFNQAIKELNTALEYMHKVDSSPRKNSILAVIYESYTDILMNCV